MGKKLKKIVEVDPIVWLKGLVAAAIGGAAGAASEVLESQLQHGSLSWSEVRSRALSGALIFVAGYLVKSPLVTPPANPAK